MLALQQPLNEFTFERFLHKIGFTDASIKSYSYQVEHFLKANPNADDYTYNDLQGVLEELGRNKKNVVYRIAILASIKKYYDYLIEKGVRNNHPCRKINIKHNRDPNIVHNDLFSSSELELLMNREERFPNLKLRNHAIISLLIYQGLTAGEIINMKVQHVNLDEGRFFVKESRDLTRRNLDMLPKQYSIFTNYISESRKNLLKGESDSLIIGSRGFPSSVCEVTYVVEQFRVLFPGRELNATTIRKSVIANWLNEKKYSLETAQLMAGHKWISTTARYRRSSDEEKRILINRFHPLG